MTLIFHSNLSKDFSSILNDSDDFNVIIQVGENQNIKEFRAHSIILRARSPYFKSAFSTKWITKKNDMIVFNKPNITPIVFEMILKYIYTGELDLTKQSCDDILELLIASDELLLEELVEYLQEYLIKQQKNCILQNFDYIFNKLTNCKKLQDYCFESICENSQPFFTTKEFLSLDKDILYELLERDDLQIDEIVAWDCLIKWGINQISIENIENIENNNNDDDNDDIILTKWNNENYETLKKILDQFIPLIRFVEISSTNFFNKIQPYKIIFPNYIYEEIQDFYYKGNLPKSLILPPRIRKIESNIIKPKHANIIINWINKKNCRTINDFNYNFKLIYRGSYDGINNKSFKNKCKGQIESLVLIKVKNSNKIFGGFSSIGFNSIKNNNLLYKDDYTSSNWLFYNSLDNFIFSFENTNDYIKDIHQNIMKISRIIDHSKAILDCNDSGFNFGQGSLCMNNRNLYLNNRNEIYENNLNTNIIYTIEEIETFVVTKQCTS